MYAPCSMRPENVKLSDSIEYNKRGWRIDWDYQKRFDAYKAKQEAEEASKTKKTTKPKSTNNSTSKTTSTKATKTSTTKKTVTKTTNKKGETVIHVSKTITLKNNK